MKSAPRVVSLISSATEMVCALGAEKLLVGRSHECDFPPSVLSVPQCSEPSFDVSGGSADIDARVKEKLQNALSLYTIDTPRLRALAPDIILTQSQCEVCAVSLAEVERALSSTFEREVRVVSLSPNNLEDIFSDIQRVGEVLGREDAAAALLCSLRARVESVRERASTHSHRPRVGVIEWLEPLMAAGNWVPELVEIAGGKNLFGVAGAHSPWMSWEELVHADPEILILLPCGFSIPRTASEVHLLSSRPEWEGLSAVREKRVFLLDGNQYFNRSGPRIVDSLEMLGELFHPHLFPARFHGHGWMRLEESLGAG